MHRKLGNYSQDGLILDVHPVKELKAKTKAIYTLEKKTNFYWRKCPLPLASKGVI